MEKETHLLFSPDKFFRFWSQCYLLLLPNTSLKKKKKKNCPPQKIMQNKSVISEWVENLQRNKLSE